jgi:anti-sigma B factor antagonist
MTAHMRITERRVADVTVLVLSGRLELDNGDTVLRDHVNQLVEEGRVNLLLDLTDVTRLDSAGIGMLVGKYLTAKRRGGTIKLLHLTDRTNRLLNITKLATVFEIFEHEDEAIRSFGVTV